MEVIAPDGESTSADTLQRFPAIEFPATPSPSAAGRPFQATTFGVPAVATVRADGRPSSALQSILDRIVDAERLPVGTGRVGFSEQERKAEDLDRRACLAHMRKRVERLMVERRKKVRS